MEFNKGEQQTGHAEVRLLVGHREGDGRLSAQKEKGKSSKCKM